MNKPESKPACVRECEGTGHVSDKEIWEKKFDQLTCINSGFYGMKELKELFSRWEAIQLQIIFQHFENVAIECLSYPAVPRESTTLF